jgi:hypothetical protein
MNETVWVALIAVLGTAFGAAITPTITAVRDVVEARANSRSDRVRAAAEFANKLITLAHMSPSRYESWDVASARTAAIDARFELARFLERGEGNVDRFAQHAIETISAYDDSRRTDAAQHSANAILDWARGDLEPKKLYRFAFEPNGDEYIIV